MEAATVRERYGNARGLSVAATVSNPMGHHPYLHDSTWGSQTSLWVERSSTLPFAMAIYSGYIKDMDVSVAEAKNNLSALLRSVADGEQVVITRNGKPVAQLVPPPPTRRKVRFDTMRGQIHLKPGWDDPIDIDRLLSGEF